MLTAYKNAGGDIDLEEALQEMHERGKQYPGGSCGFWGMLRRGRECRNVRKHHNRYDSSVLKNLGMVK